MAAKLGSLTGMVRLGGRALVTVLLYSFAAIVAPAQNLIAPSTEKERALGRQLAADIEARTTLLNDAGVDGYLQQLAERLNGNAGGEISFIVKALADQAPHAIALPGGYLYFSSGLLAAIPSEAELAAVMAHELAHITARHGIRPAAGVLSGPAVPLIFLGGWNGMCSRFASPGVYPRLYRSAAAEFELEADSTGRELLALAGFDPGALESAFNRLASVNEPAVAPTQPAPPANSSPAFEAVQQRVQKGAAQPANQAPTLRPNRN